MTQSILDVRGIGPAMQIVLAKQGFKTIVDLANTTVELLAVTPGISETKAAQVIADARNLLATDIPDENLTSTKTKNKDKDKDKKSTKKSKKDKKKEKKRKKEKDNKKDKQKSKKSKK